MRYGKILFFLLFCPIHLFSQFNNVDSLIKKSKTIENYTERVSVDYQIIESYIQKGLYLDAFDKAELLLEESLNNKYEFGMAKACFYIAKLLVISGEIEKSTHYFKQAVAYFKMNGYYEELASLYKEKIICYLRVNRRIKVEMILNELISLYPRLDEKNRNDWFLYTADIYRKLNKNQISYGWLRRLEENKKGFNKVSSLKKRLVQLGLLYNMKKDSLVPGELKKFYLLSETIDESEKKRRIQLDLVDLMINHNQYAEALFILQKMLKNQSNDEDVNLCPVYKKIALVYSAISHYKESLEYYLLALNLAEKHGYYKSQAEISNSIGLIYTELEDYSQANQYFYKALKLYGFEMGYSIGVYITHFSLGFCFQREYPDSNSSENYKKALDLEKYFPTHLVLFKTYLNLAGIEFKKKRLDSCEYYLNKAISGIEYFKPKWKELSDAYLLKSDLLKERGLFEESVRYSRLYSEMKDSLHHHQIKEVFNQFQINRKMEEVNKEIELLEKEAKINRLELTQTKWIRNASVFILFLLGVLAIVIYNRYRYKEKSNRILLDLNKTIRQQNLKIIKDLELAKKLQFSLLPKTYPVFNNVQIKGFLESSENLSGDFFDVFRISENEVVLYIIDVCGHGTSSAMLTMFVKEIIDSYKENEEVISSPKKVLNLLNKKTKQANFENHAFKWYFTMSYMIYDSDKKMIRYGNAAHPTVYRFKNEKGLYRVEKLFEPSFAIGWFDEVDFTEKETSFGPGDKIVMMTDGIIETMNKKEEHFGEERALDLVLDVLKDRDHFDDLDGVYSELKKKLIEFSGSSHFEDDVTLMIMDSYSS